MTKKDYEAFANKIYAYHKDGVEVRNTISICQSVFKADNPAFKADKFEEACLTGKHIRKSIKGEL